MPMEKSIVRRRRRHRRRHRRAALTFECQPAVARWKIGHCTFFATDAVENEPWPMQLGAACSMTNENGATAERRRLTLEFQSIRVYID